MAQDRNVDSLRLERFEGGVDVLWLVLPGVRDDDLRPDPHYDAITLADIDEDDLGGRGVGGCTSRDTRRRRTADSEDEHEDCA